MSDQILIQFRSDLAEFRKELNDVKQQITGAGKAAEDAGKQSNASFSKLSDTIKGVGAALGVAFSVQQVVAFAKEAVQLAKQAEGIEKAFSKLNKRGLLDELRDAVNGTVSDVKLMQAAVKANNFKLPLDQLATLFKFAAQRARDTGEEVDYLVESIVLGISRKSIPILDNLGLSASQIQKEFEKTGDMATAVGNIINQSMGSDSPKGAATVIDQATARIENMKTKFGELLLMPTSSLAQTFNKFFEGFEGMVDVVDKIANAEDVVVEKRVKRMTSYYDKVIANTKETYKGVVDIDKATEGFIENVIRGERNIERLKKESELSTLGGIDIDKAIEKQISAIRERAAAQKIIYEQEQEAAKAATAANEEKAKAEKAASNEKIKLKKEELEKIRALEDKAILDDLEAQIEADRRGEEMAKEIDDRKKKQLEDWLQWQKDFFGESEDAYEESEINKTEITQEELAVREALLRAYEDISRALVDRAFAEMQRKRDDDLDNELSSLEKQRNAEINSKERTESEIAKINAKYDAQAKKIKQDKWRKDKNAAILMTNINTAGAVMAAYFREGAYGAIIAGIAGAAQLAIIASQPEPKFHKGEIDIRPKGKKRLKNGEFKATLIEGESVINSEATAKYKEELQAINDKKFDDLLLKKYILPVLEERIEKSKTTGQNMANNIRMQSYNGSNVVEMLMRVNATSKENTAILATALKQFKRDYRQPQ